MTTIDHVLNSVYNDFEIFEMENSEATEESRKEAMEWDVN